MNHLFAPFDSSYRTPAQHYLEFQLRRTTFQLQIPICHLRVYIFSCTCENIIISWLSHSHTQWWECSQLANIHHINRRTTKNNPGKLTVPNQSEFLHNASRNLFSHVFFTASLPFIAGCIVPTTQCMTTSSAIVSAKNCHSTKSTYFMFSCILSLLCTGHDV